MRSPFSGVSILVVAVMLTAGAQPAVAQVTPPNLGEATLEELMAMRVTSASRKAHVINVITRSAACDGKSERRECVR